MADIFKFRASFFDIMIEKSILRNLNNANKDLREYFSLKLANHPFNTQRMKLFELNKFFIWIDKYNVADITKEDIITFLEHPKFIKLKNSSKNSYMNAIRKLLTYFKRDDLVYIVPHFKLKNKEINKNKLITRMDLNKLLRSCEGIQQKTLMMILYEGALRKEELLFIRMSDIKFCVDDGNISYINLFVGVSKTSERNLPLKESIPFLKEYFTKHHFEAEEKLFDYNHNYINRLINQINERCKQKYPNHNKRIYPHLFRHSRLTELANILNEQQLRYFAGWAKESNMASIYVHLDDSDIRNALFRGSGVVVPKPTIQMFEPITCPYCKKENDKNNDICYNCGKILNPNMMTEITSKIAGVSKDDQIQQLNKKVDQLMSFYLQVQRKMIQSQPVPEPPSISDMDIEVSDEVLQDAIEEEEYNEVIKEHPKVAENTQESIEK